MDDPITLPRRMMEVTVGATGTPSDQQRQSLSGPLFGYSYGITDRLTWQGVLAFQVRVAGRRPDPDTPSTGVRAAGAPLGLAADGAAWRAFGFSLI